MDTYGHCSIAQGRQNFLDAWLFDSNMYGHFMFLESPLLSKFWLTLIAWVFDSLMYWHFMCPEVSLLTEFRTTLIAWEFDSLMYWNFMCLEVTLTTEFWITLIAVLSIWLQHILTFYVSRQKWINNHKFVKSRINTQMKLTISRLKEWL